MKLACPNCGSDVVYKPDTGNIYCSHCNKETTISSLNDNINRVANGEGFEKYLNVCSSCGAEFLTLSKNLVKVCNYCGSQNISKRQYNQYLNDRYVIPFKYAKDDVLNLYRKLMKYHKYTNVKYFNEANIKEITGTYIPITKTIVDLKMSTLCKIKDSYTDENDTIAYKYRYFDVTADFSLQINLDSSKSFPDSIFSKIGDYNFSEAKTFSPYYFAGFASVMSDDFFSQKLVKSSSGLLKGLYRYIYEESERRYYFRYYKYGISLFNTSLYYNTKEIRKYYVPVWNCSYIYNGKKYSFVINGQTGKMLYDFPIDNNKIKRFALKKSLVLSGIIMLIAIASNLFFLLYLILLEINLALIIFPFVITIVVCIYCFYIFFGKESAASLSNFKNDEIPFYKILSKNISSFRELDEDNIGKEDVNLKVKIDNENE